MSTEALMSDVITDMVASAQTLIDPQKDGQICRQRATVSVSNGSIGSTYRMLSIPSNAIVKDVKVGYEDLLTGTVAGGFDVGICLPLADIRLGAGGAAIDADLFANSLDCTTAVTTPTSVMMQSGALTHSELNNTVWENGGSTISPSATVDVVATVVDTALDTVGRLVVDVEYIPQ